MADRRTVEAAAIPTSASAEPYDRPEGRPQLGSLLLRDGIITAEQLAAALAQKEAEGGRLGEILLRYNVTSASAIAQALAEQYGFEFLELSRFDLVPAATSLLPENVARRLSALPIALDEDGTVVVAVTDPTDVMASDDLRLALGLQIRFVVVSTLDLSRTLDRCFRGNVNVEMESDLEEDAPSEDITEGGATDAPAIKLTNQIIANAIAEGASDIHFEPQPHAMVVRARIDGVMRKVAEVPTGLTPAVTSRLKIMGELDIADRRNAQDGRISIRYDGDPVDLRIAVLPTTFGEKVVLRILHRASGRLNITDLGMNPEAEAVLMRALKQPYGAVLTVGPTGSGKTTTLYAALEFLNDDERSLATIEDPVENQIPGITQVEVNVRARPDVRERPADDASLRPRRRPDRRGPRRGDGAHRDPGGDDRPPRADDAAHPQRRQLDRTAAGHGRRPVADRDLDQLHRRAAARAPALRPLPRGLRPDAGGEDRRRAPRRPRGGRDALPPARLRRVCRLGLPRPRRHLRGDADRRQDPASDRGVDRGDLRGRRRPAG